jgi:peptidoglycan/xylan/chitin deacetylase (PgdA/CDA1 family)
VERLVLASGMVRLRSAAFRGRTLVLAYHNVVPRGAPPVGERALHLGQDRLAEHLDLLADQTDVIPLDVALGSADGQKPRVVITWDDAYAGAVTVGVEELVRRKLPATIFVPPGRLGGQTFWWDRLASRHGGEIPRVLRDRALEECRGQEEVIESKLGMGIDVALPAYARSATEADLSSAASKSGITFGSHSWSHVNLTQVSTDDLAMELHRSHEWLRQRYSNVLPALSYPYGAESITIRPAVEAAGYTTGWCIRGGWLPTGSTDCRALPRLNVPAGLSVNGLALRLAGFFGR